MWVNKGDYAFPSLNFLSIYDHLSRNNALFGRFMTYLNITYMITITQRRKVNVLHNCKNLIFCVNGQISNPSVKGSRCKDYNT